LGRPGDGDADGTGRGFHHRTIDEMVGPGSREAIGTFQKAQGLPVTGLINLPLLKALKLPAVPRGAGLSSVPKGGSEAEVIGRRGCGQTSLAALARCVKQTGTVRRPCSFNRFAGGEEPERVKSRMADSGLECFWLPCSTSLELDAFPRLTVVD
jgi:hypothetical protein